MVHVIGNISVISITFFHCNLLYQLPNNCYFMNNRDTDCTCTALAWFRFLTECQKVHY